MTPAQFTDNDVASIGEGVADMYRMVSTLDVLRRAVSQIVRVKRGAYLFPIFFVFGHDAGRGIGAVRHRVCLSLEEAIRIAIRGWGESISSA